MKIQRIANSYRTERAETLRAGQDLRATEEGASGVAESNHDDDTQVSEGGHRRQLRRGFLKTSKTKREKKKLRRNDVVIGTWNVRTMLVEGKLELLLQELKDNQTNITGLSETRWGKREGKDGVFKRGEHTIVFSGDKSGENGVAIILDKKYAASMISHNCISDRLVTSS